MRRIYSLIRYTAYILATLLLLGLAWFAVPAQVVYHLTETYTFTAMSQASDLRLGVLLPRSGPYQQVSDPVVEWHGQTETIAHPSLDELHLTGPLAANETRAAVIRYKVTLTQGRARWDGPTSPALLQPQPQIESDDPALAGQAASLVSGNSRADAYRLFAFTAGYIQWPTGSRTGGSASARQAYEERIGGCTEFANLYTSLARAAGIPARSVEGLAMPLYYPPYMALTATWNSPAGAHAWNEVYTGADWEFADASWASSLPVKQTYFGRTDGAHLAYGEVGEVAAIYAAMQDWAQSEGEMIGGMSAPLHFTASAAPGSSGQALLPAVTVQKGWDTRWVLVVGVYLACLVLLRLIENRLKKKAQEPGRA